jgi:hypothetical protein
MEKEEEHLLPIFLQTMSSTEMKQLMDMSTNKSVSLNNMRHQNSINMARKAAGLDAVDYHVADAPSNVDSPSWFIDEDQLFKWDCADDGTLAKVEDCVF